MTEAHSKWPRAGNGYEPLGKAEILGRNGATLRLKVGATIVEITALAEDLFRVGAFPRGKPVEYHSEAVAKTVWEPLEPAVAEQAGNLSLSTSKATAFISLNPLRIRFGDPSGRVFAADDERLGMGLAGSNEPAIGLCAPEAVVRVYKRRGRGERYFGCGERTGGLEKTGSRLLFWNIDPPAGHSPSFNNLYVSIPFVFSLQAGAAHGLLFDNTRRAAFDLARTNADLSCFEATGGNLIYYVFCGPTPRAVLARYTELTGRIPMPPLWALGNQQSRWSYRDESHVRRVAREFRNRDIPCDVIHLDIDYMDGYRVFTWDRDRFPNPETLISELREDGFRVVAIVDPGVKVDEHYPVYTEGRDEGFYCRTFEGEEYRNTVWPGVCAFPDFTGRRVREWWGGHHAALLDAGVAGIWCDMNEPALGIPERATMPPDVVHPGDGKPRLHRQIHNLYGTLMARAAHEGIRRLRPQSRPFVLTRSGYAGVQRHALLWTGDNSSWWEHLAMALPQLQNLGLSGAAWAGVDIGGFYDDCNGELLARFTEFGVFQPFCRNHSAKGTMPQEPWAFGEPCQSVCRKMIQLRMRLIPYLYTLFEACHRTGVPILRPLLFEYPDDPATYAMDDQFLLGSALLVAPVTRPGVEYRYVYLPSGTWFHYWTGERFDGPAHMLAHAPLGQPALYVKANTPLPLGPPMSHTGERPVDPLTFLVYPAEGRGEFVLYEDAGEGFGYRKGAYARRSISCETGDRVTIRLGAREGAFVPDRREIRLELPGMPNIGGVKINGETFDRYRSDGDRLVLRLSEQAGAATVEVYF
ncbi:MAG: glycoside hydrolase family 31 protein [Methylohalobius sp. ZOD2]